MIARRATRIALLMAAPFAAWAQSDAERARMEYERQQREYWRAQEAQRLEEARRQQQWDEHLKREQENQKKHEFRMDAGIPTGPSDSAVGSGPRVSGDPSAAEMRALREKLLAQPALAPERNPLLGRWRVASSGTPARKDDVAQLLGMLANPGGAVCRMVFGDGITEFGAKYWASIDGHGNDSLGGIAYRTDGKRVWAIPDKGIELMGFDLSAVDRAVSVNLENCVLVRSAAVAATARREPSGRAAQPMPGAAGPSRPPPEVCRQLLIDRIGSARVDEARRVIAARFQQSIDGHVPGGANLRVDARGSACDDPRVNATLYDFNAGGVLQEITIVWARPAGPAPASIFSERAQLLSNWYTKGLTRSASQFQGQADKARVVLQDVPERALLLEAYGAPK